MKSLWFKAEFVEAILSGKKRDTIRRASNRLPVVGEQVAFSVGPRTPFTVAEITAITPARMNATRRNAVAKLYGNADNMVMLRFRLLQ
jgi:hypothetical protein